MGLSRVDCYQYQTPGVRSDGAVSEVSGVCVLNPSHRPGGIFMICARPVREAIGSQVAVKLAFQHLRDSVIATMGSEPQGLPEAEANEWVVAVLEKGLGQANRAVFDFGAKLGAGGRTSASILSFLVSQGAVAVARAGIGSMYLLRERSLFPFFEDRDERVQGDPTHGLHVGVQPSLSVEIASVGLQGADQLFFFSRPLTLTERDELMDRSEAIRRSKNAMFNRFCSTLATPVEYAFGVDFGPDAIYLGRAIGSSPVRNAATPQALMRSVG